MKTVMCLPSVYKLDDYFERGKEGAVRYASLCVPDRHKGHFAPFSFVFMCISVLHYCSLIVMNAIIIIIPNYYHYHDKS